LITSIPIELKHYCGKTPHYKELIQKLNLNKMETKLYAGKWKKKHGKPQTVYKSQGVVGALIDFVLLKVQNFVGSGETSYKDSIDDDLIVKTNSDEKGTKTRNHIIEFSDLWEKELSNASALYKSFKADLKHAFKVEETQVKSNLIYFFF
jgi:hypothetical protein